MLAGRYAPRMVPPVPVPDNHATQAPGGLYQSVDLRPLLGRIISPTLIVAGELDFICGPAQAQPIAAAVTGSQLVMIAGCGHIPSIEAPQEYRQAVADFLRR